MNAPLRERTADRVEVTIPFPPSVNKIWAPVEAWVESKDAWGRPQKKRVSRTVKRSSYKKWMQGAAWQIKAQQPARVPGAYKLEILVPWPQKWPYPDLGNLEKAVSDCLVLAGVIDDDRWCVDINPRYANCGHSDNVVAIITRVTSHGLPIKPKAA